MLTDSRKAAGAERCVVLMNKNTLLPGHSAPQPLRGALNSGHLCVC